MQEAKSSKLCVKEKIVGLVCLGKNKSG